MDGLANSPGGTLSFTGCTRFRPPAPAPELIPEYASR